MQNEPRQKQDHFLKSASSEAEAADPQSEADAACLPFATGRRRTDNIDDDTVDMKTIMDEMKLKRYCCRRMIMGYVDFEYNAAQEANNCSIPNE